MAVEEAVGETIIAAIHGSHANRAGSFFERQSASGQAAKCRSAMNNEVLRDMYAKRPINIYKAPEGTYAATETTG